MIGLFCIEAFAAININKSIAVEWSPYVPPTSYTVSGFELYQEGTKVCSFIGSSITKGDCSVILTKEQTPFTLTAKFSDGTESSQSVPYTFVYVPPTFDKTQFPVLIQIQIN